MLKIKDNQGRSVEMNLRMIKSQMNFPKVVKKMNTGKMSIDHSSPAINRVDGGL